MFFKRFINRIQTAALDFIRKWWRPVGCIGIAGGAIVNLIVIPLITWTVPNMAEAAAYVAAMTAAFAIREVGKRWGTAE